MFRIDEVYSVLVVSINARTIESHNNELKIETQITDTAVVLDIVELCHFIVLSF